jgi:hypothetical protein
MGDLGQRDKPRRCRQHGRTAARHGGVVLVAVRVSCKVVSEMPHGKIDHLIAAADPRARAAILAYQHALRGRRDWAGAMLGLMWLFLPVLMP